MALPDYFTREFGTAIVWGEAGGSGVTNTLSLDALADAAGRMGASVDLGAVWYGLMLLELVVETGTAPAIDRYVECYLAWSRNNSDWPGKVTGSDAAYPSTVAQNKKQLGYPSAVLISTADSNTILRQNAVVVIARARYVAPVVINLLGQSFRDETTASNNDSRVILTPIRQLIQDSA